MNELNTFAIGTIVDSLIQMPIAFDRGAAAVRMRRGLVTRIKRQWPFLWLAGVPLFGGLVLLMQAIARPARRDGSRILRSARMPANVR